MFITYHKTYYNVKYMTGLSFNSNNKFKTSQSAILDEIIFTVFSGKRWSSCQLNYISLALYVS